MERRPIRVVVGKVGLDGHDRGAKVIAQACRDAGMEVVYTGLRRSPEELAEITLQEDADALGLSILSGGAVRLTKRVLEALKSKELQHVLLVVGGIVSPSMAKELQTAGVHAVFGPGSSLQQIIDVIRREVEARRSRASQTGE